MYSPTQDWRHWGIRQLWQWSTSQQLMSRQLALPGHQQTWYWSAGLTMCSPTANFIDFKPIFYIWILNKRQHYQLTLCRTRLTKMPMTFQPRQMWIIMGNTNWAIITFRNHAWDTTEMIKLLLHIINKIPLHDKKWKYCKSLIISVKYIFVKSLSATSRSLVKWCLFTEVSWLNTNCDYSVHM